jgi:hypothetical protein
MPDRFAANTAHTEELLDQLGIPLPARVARSRAQIDAMGELDVVSRPPLNMAQLAQHTLAQIEAGQKDIDLLAIVRENASNSATGEATALLRAMNEHAERVLEQAIRGAAGELLPITRSATLAVFAQVRQLGSVPASADDAIGAGTGAVKVFQAFKTLGDRYGKLRSLHAELLAGYVGDTAFFLHRDTKCWPTFASGKPEPAGPVDPLRRLLWLSTPEAQAWVPDRAECDAQYSEVLLERQKPKAPATVLSATTTVRSS